MLFEILSLSSYILLCSQYQALAIVLLLIIIIVIIFTIAGETGWDGHRVRARVALLSCGDLLLLFAGVRVDGLDEAHEGDENRMPSSRIDRSGKELLHLHH